MREVKKITIKSRCNCNKPQITLEVNYPFDKGHLQHFLNNNFIELKSYTNVGILYVEDANVAAMGPFGSNRLQIKCKTALCDNSVLLLENILKTMP